MTGASASTSSGDSSCRRSRPAASCTSSAERSVRPVTRWISERCSIRSARRRREPFRPRASAQSPQARASSYSPRRVPIWCTTAVARTSWSSTQPGGPVVPGRQRHQLVHHGLDLAVARLDRPEVRRPLRDAAEPPRVEHQCLHAFQLPGHERQSSPAIGRRCRRQTPKAGNRRAHWLDSSAGPRRPTHIFDNSTQKAEPRAWQRRTTSRTAWCSTSTASSGRSSGSSTTSPARAARSCAPS